MRLSKLLRLIEIVKNFITVETELRTMSRLRVSTETISRQIETPKLTNLTRASGGDKEKMVLSIRQEQRMG